MAALSALLRSLALAAALFFPTTTTALAPPVPDSNGIVSAAVTHPPHPLHPPPLPPSDAAARRNAFAIFNAVHAAMRQWGSSLNHNGMSLFLATVPAGQLFYHGSREAARPRGVHGTGAEWLAFEVEHAQMFATPQSDRRVHAPRPQDDGSQLLRDSRRFAGEAGEADRAYDTRHGRQQQPLGDGDDGQAPPDPPPTVRGYFHTYRANRPLNLLYIDGMAAGKSIYGCADTQDSLLLDRPEDERGGRGIMGDEFDRALGLCRLAKEWSWRPGGGGGSRIDGFVRAEAGFEIIYCDLGGDEAAAAAAGGLDLVSVQASPLRNETGGLPVFSDIEYLRGVTQRYHGQPAGRIAVDWSSMVSALFYDVNLTNPDPARPELPRLVGVPRAARRGIRARLRQVVAARGVGAVDTVDWQGIVDLVVTRFSRRLQQLARDTSAPITALAGQMLPTLLNPYLSYGGAAGGPEPDDDDDDDERLDRCMHHYLSGALVRQSTWTPEDGAIFAAVETVTRTICTSLFAMRTVVSSSSSGSSGNSTAEAAVRRLVDDLMGQLQWTTWRECDPCPQADEMCLVAMFPWGDEADHFRPRCQKADELLGRSGYWRNG